MSVTLNLHASLGHGGHARCHKRASARRGEAPFEIDPGYPSASEIYQFAQHTVQLKITG